MNMWSWSVLFDSLWMMSVSCFPYVPAKSEKSSVYSYKNQSMNCIFFSILMNLHSAFYVTVCSLPSVRPDCWRVLESTNWTAPFVTFEVSLRSIATCARRVGLTHSCGGRRNQSS